MPEFEYDAFISHAWEDKSTFVEPLVLELNKLGLKAWYDRFSLRVGDSLHDSIELGLANSRYGVVVFSPAFFAKNWTKAELNGLVAREMDGHKVILPIWHQLTRADVLKSLPIMADKLALLSSDGVASVAKSLVEVIRPELLTVENSTDAAVLAGKRLAEAVNRDHPGYEIRLNTGPSISITNPGPKSEGVIASIFQDGLRADIFVNDAEKLKQPPQMQLHFSSAGLGKIKEGVRTGKAQSLISGEFRFGGSSIPMMPPAENIDSGRLEVVPSVAGVPELDVRLEVDAAGGVLRVPVMKQKVVRAGTEEIEFLLYHPAQPFQIGFAHSLRPGGPPQDFNLSTLFSSFDFSRIDTCVKFIDALMAGGEFRIFDLTTDRIFMRAGMSQEAGWMPRGLETLIAMVASIEQYFRVSIPWPSRIPDDEIEKAHILNCLISGEEFGTNLSLTAMCPKNSSLRTHSKIWKNSPISLFFESTDPDKVTTLFGVPIPVPSWGMYTEQATPVDVETAVCAVEDAPEGSIVLIPMRGLSPTFVRFKSSLGASALGTVSMNVEAALNS
jgi:TIR domain